MDFDYEGSEDFGGRILWPRVGLFVLLAVLVFLLGRCTSGGGDVAQEDYDEVVAQNSELEVTLTQQQASIEQLQQELLDARAAGQPTAPGNGTGTTGGTEGPTDAGTGAPVGPADAPTDQQGNRQYEVQPGDTLATIAEAVYGDPTAFGAIAAANNIGGDNILQVGQTLVIPPNPDQ